MSIVIADGERLHYRLHRDEPGPGGRPLLLVHGAGGSLMHWPAELRRLPGHSVYALDLPGHGGSGGAGREEIGAYAEVVKGFADGLSLPPFVLGGHSMGGAIALEFALRYPTRLVGLVLVGTGAKLRVAPQILNGLLNDFEGTAGLLATWTHGTQPPPNLLRLYVRRLRDVDPRVTRGDFVACDLFDRRSDIARIQLPALVICGEEDRMTPPKFSEFLAGQLGAAQLVVISGAGHMVMLERPAAVAEAVAGFLERR